MGASKGVGVAKLLEALGIKAENLMALGDGENDIGMLKVFLWSLSRHVIDKLLACSA